MAFIQRSFSGDLFRPRPEILVDSSQRLLIVATPWGPRSTAKKAVQIIQDYFHSSQQDEEATSPFSRMACLSPLANDLRIAVKLANDAICHEENKSEYVSGLELFVLARKNHEVAWAQVGYPYILLDRPHRPLSALGSQMDLAVEHSFQSRAVPPLPGKLLGLDMSSDFAVESFRPAKNDRFVMISRSAIPAALYDVRTENRNIDEFSKVLAADDGNLPFWLGIFDFTAA